MRQVISLLIALTIAINCEAFEVNGVYYAIRPEDPTTVRVCKNNYNFQELIIPATVSHNGRTYKVTEYEEGAFAGSNCVIQKLTLSPNAPKISYELCKYSHVRRVVVPEGVIEIDGRAFENSLLEMVDLPNTLQVIGIYAFNGCRYLTDLYIPSSVTRMGSGQTANALFLRTSNRTLSIFSTSSMFDGGRANAGFNVQNLYIDRPVEVLLKGYGTKKSERAYFSPSFSLIIGPNASNYGIDSNSLKYLFVTSTYPPRLTDSECIVNRNNCTLYTLPKYVEKYGIAPFWQTFRHIEPINVRINYFPSEWNDVIERYVNGQSQPQRSTSSVSDSDKTTVYTQVDQGAEYLGGPTALSRFISSNLKYPEEANKNNIQGKVILRLPIESDGSISDITVTQSVHQLLDNEALRVAKKMQRFKPAVKNGVPVRSYFSFPMTFKLAN